MSANPLAPIQRRLFDYTAAATYLGIGKRGVERLVAAGELAKVEGISNKVLIDRADLDAFVDRKKAGA